MITHIITTCSRSHVVTCWPGSEVEVDFECPGCFSHGSLQILAVHGSTVRLEVDLFAESIGELLVVAIVLFAQEVALPEVISQ